MSRATRTGPDYNTIGFARKVGPLAVVPRKALPEMGRYMANELGRVRPMGGVAAIPRIGRSVPLTGQELYHFPSGPMRRNLAVHKPRHYLEDCTKTIAVLQPKDRLRVFRERGCVAPVRPKAPQEDRLLLTCARLVVEVPFLDDKVHGSKQPALMRSTAKGLEDSYQERWGRNDNPRKPEVGRNTEELCGSR